MMQSVIIASFVSFLMIVLFYNGFKNHFSLAIGPGPNVNNKNDSDHKTLIKSDSQIEA